MSEKIFGGLMAAPRAVHKEYAERTGITHHRQARVIVLAPSWKAAHQAFTDAGGHESFYSFRQWWGAGSGNVGEWAAVNAVGALVPVVRMLDDRDGKWIRLEDAR